MASITKLNADGKTIPKGSPERAAKYRARWRTPEGGSRSETFPTKVKAERKLAEVEASKLAGVYVDRADGLVTLDEWFDRWVADRRTSTGEPLRPKTVALYRHLYAKHLEPSLGRVALSDISPQGVRRWYGSLPGKTVPAKCYRLLRAMLNTAVDDGVIVRNPCRIKGGGVERSPERPIPTGDEVWALADAVGDRWRALLLTSAFAGLRWGELIGLERRDIDLDAATVTVERQIVEAGGEQIVGLPKTDAGVRTIALPMVLVPVLREHLEQYVGPEGDDRVFTTVKGRPPRNAHFGNEWRRARGEVGREDLTFHDMRHFAHTLAAQSGATTKELMARLGHSSPAAALRYQHATAERDRTIADRMDAMIGLGEAAG